VLTPDIGDVRQSGAITVTTNEITEQLEVIELHANRALAALREALRLLEQALELLTRPSD
jgi:hypothetical protein